jgi:PAS domain S-box-containing protein
MVQSNDNDRASLSGDERYRLLIESVTDYAICMLDPTGVVISWNPGAQRVKGYAAPEIIGQHFSRFYTDEDRARDLPARALEAARREGKFEGEGWRVRKDGGRFWASVVIDPIRLPSGELIGFAKITRDLTERRAAEEALRRSQEQFKLLVQGVTDYAIYLLSPDGTVTSWNQGAERIKGYAADEIVGSHFSRFYTEEDRAAGAPDHALAAVRREGRFEREAWRVRKDGTRFYAHVVIDAIRDEQGELIGFAKITRDITEKREAQANLERTREALLQSQKMDAIGQLTGGIAHDFNNLLMVVLGSLELMRKRLPNDPKLKRLLENAVKGAQRGASLTKRMLAFARTQEFKREAVDLPDLVRGMTELLQRSLGSVVAIETRFPLSMRPVYADANQLEMVLLNLTMNARDAMPAGGQIIISAKEETIGQDDFLNPGAYVCLAVRDEGTGMDEDTLKRATEPFFTTKEPGKGTGLGLSMVHGIAEQSGGRFVLRSRRGEGTTAEVWIPVAGLGARAAKAHEPAPQPDPMGSLVVLAVDDDALVLTNTVAMLEDLGHRPLAASSAAEALAILTERGHVDLIITDHVMPRMTGLQLVQAVRNQRPELPIILATGYAELTPGESPDLPRLGKPFTQDELAALIARSVERSDREGRVVKFPSNGNGGR